MITTEEWRKRHNTEFRVPTVCEKCDLCSLHVRLVPIHSEFGKEFDIKCGYDTLAHTGMHSFLGFQCEGMNRWVLG